MADNLPINFPIPAESTIASYDWTDIAQAVGIIEFYPYVAEDANSDEYMLSSAAIYSKTIETRTSGGSSFGNSQTWKLPTFKKPAIIEGTGTMSFSVRYDINTVNGYVYMYAIVQKVSGGVTTDLVSVQTANENNGYVDTQRRVNIVLEIPKTSFGIGDQLQVVFGIIRAGSQSSSENLDVGHDPVNRAGTYITSVPTKAVFYCPFKIDL